MKRNKSFTYPAYPPYLFILDFEAANGGVLEKKKRCS